MSAVSSEGGQDFDLNLAPIIDCFTVLITYLLVSASFISLTALDVGVAAAGQAADQPAAQPKTPPFNMMIQLTAQKVINLKISGGPKNIDLTIPVLPAGGAAWNRVGLDAQVHRALRTFPGIQEATLMADSAVVYKDVVHVVEDLKKIIPKVFLSGT